MTINYQEVANFYESEFKRYTLAIAEQSLPTGQMIDRIDPSCRVLRSDLGARFPELNNTQTWIDVQPYIEKVIRSLKRRKIWKG